MSRAALWRLVLGSVLLLGIGRGGTTSNPEWIADVVDVALFALAIWLVFTAGRSAASNTT